MKNLFPTIYGIGWLWVIQSSINTYAHTQNDNTLVSSPLKCKQHWKPVRPDWHNGLPPSILSLTLWGETPHCRRWRDPLRLNEMTPSHSHWLTHSLTHTHTQNHRRTIIRSKATNWLAWLCVNTNWMWGSSCCCRQFSQRWRGEEEKRKRKRASECVCVCVCVRACVCVFGIKNLVSRCVIPHADSQLPVCEAGALPVFLSEHVSS